MEDNRKKHIFVVDDDSCIRDVVSLHLEKMKFECTCFEYPDDCLRHLHMENCSLLITDIKMPGKSGLELLAEAKSIVPWLPVLVMTGYGDIPLAVKAIQAGAIDFIEKPFEWDSFLALVQSIVSRNTLSYDIGGRPLTKKEVVILRLILQGRSNTEIAQILHRSARTVEVHRSHIMHKLNVDNVVDLVKRAIAMDLDNTLIEKIQLSNPFSGS